MPGSVEEKKDLLRVRSWLHRPIRPTPHVVIQAPSRELEI